MSKLKDKRLEAVEFVMKNYGIEYGDKVFITLCDLACTLNNSWYAEIFVNEKHCEYSGTKLVVKSWRLHEFFRGIRHAVKDTRIELRESYSNKTEYLVKSND